MTKPPNNPEISSDILSDIPRSLVIIFKIQTGIERGYNKALFVSSVVNKIKTRAKNPSNRDDVIELINYIEKMNLWSKENNSKDLISNRSPIWKIRSEFLETV